jgi:putative oxidoreductase
MNKFFYWAIRIIPAVIMLQTLYFKFTAHPQSVKLFTILGMEPWGRIGIGVFELIAAVLLLINRTVLLGALLGVGLMCGAIFFHLTNSNIGIYFEGDPVLFIYAVITLLCCGALVLVNRKQIPALLKLKF